MGRHATLVESHVKKEFKGKRQILKERLSETDYSRFNEAFHGRLYPDSDDWKLWRDALQTYASVNKHMNEVTGAPVIMSIYNSCTLGRRVNSRPHPPALHPPIRRRQP